MQDRARQVEEEVQGMKQMADIRRVAVSYD